MPETSHSGHFKNARTIFTQTDSQGNISKMYELKTLFSYTIRQNHFQGRNFELIMPPKDGSSVDEVPR